MLNQMAIFLSFGAVVFVLAAINALFIVYSYKTNKKLDAILEKGKIKDFKRIFLSQKDKNQELDKKIEEAFLKIKDLDQTCQITFQKMGVVRFNPFKEVGGNQSFVIALLDNKNNGFLISSLFIGDRSRVYAKAIKDGKSEHLLSAEEEQAIELAMESKNKIL